MNVAVIIPVGPGHEKLAKRANRSVTAAWKQSPGPFSICRVAMVPDPHGELGRSRARNRGLDENPADWHFLLDADDEMCLGAFELVDLEAPATFGAICLKGRRYVDDVWPCTRELILHRRFARGTLSMGCFVRGDLGLRFDESLDVGEDFDFYLRLPSFTKREEPLVSIGYDQPSAGGPRGYETVSWLQVCDHIIARYSPPSPVTP